MAGLSLHAALGQRQQLAADLSLRRGKVDARDEDGDRCPLHWAAARGHTDCALLLLKAGADPSMRDANGRTCEELATPDVLMVLKAWTLDSAAEFANREGSIVRRP